MTDYQFACLCVALGGFLLSAVVAAWQEQAIATRRQLDAGALPPRWLHRFIRNNQREG